MKSGDVCSFETCRRPLAIEVEQSGRTSIVSQEAHIVAETPNGPRGESALTLEDRNSYPNLMLLCLEHHKVVDDDPETFTVDVLLAMKAAHEQWFDSLRDPADERREAQELLMVNIVDEWEERADIENWRYWVSSFLGYRLWIDDEIVDRLHALDLWVYSRSWPDVYLTLPPALENLRRVASALFSATDCALDRRADDHAREYVPDHKRDLMSQEHYQESVAEAQWIRDLFGDLALELTRAANWVLDEVRLVVDPRYKADLGVLLVERQEGLGSSYYRPRYGPDDIAGGMLAFRGLREFLADRRERDYSIGQGFHEDGYKRVTPYVFGEDED
jgi:hypothetical protein